MYVIETDPRLLRDPLWTLLNQAIQRIKTDPSRYLHRADPDSPHGLSVAEINRLAGESGPVFKLTRSRLSDRAEIWTLTVHHPTPAVEPVEWRQSTFDSRPSAHKVEVTLAFLEAWRDQRGRVVAKPRMTVQQANDKARELAGRLGKAFFDKTSRQLAEEIGCSEATVRKTTLWCNNPKRTGGRKAGDPKTSGSVTFTRGMESVTTTGERDEVINQLIRDQEADAEPSPLDDSPRKVRVNPRI